MTFTWLNKQGVASDTGFSLQSVGRFEWEYRKDGRTISLGGEPTSVGGTHGFAFGRDWSPPPFSADDRNVVQANITAAMSFMGLKAEFD